jgi:DNA (cytosine-5)-methyltransferase 1
MLSKSHAEHVDALLDKIDKQKSQVSAVVTACLEKIRNPEQDIRFHRVDFEGGYSARSLDTKVTTPFFKKHFPRYANKESAFLSMSTRERIPWTKKDGMQLKIRDKTIKKSFIEIIESVQDGAVDPRKVIGYIFIKLYELSQQHKIIFDGTIETSDFLGVININTVLTMLDEHFAQKLGSRLPVIAIYTAYEHLRNQVNRYHGKILRTLNVHTSSDKHGYGDVEIWNDDGTPFEMVEIKHGIPIDRNMVFDVVKKSENTGIERYYVLTTAKENFVSPEEEEYINKFILKIRNDSGMDIIANGIRYSLKYYLRFVDDCRDFIKSYTRNLIVDAKNSAEVQESHIVAWREILTKHKLAD